MDARLDSLQKEFQPSQQDSLRIGFSKVSITPSGTVPLAGYSGRKPKEFNEILDSVFVRVVVMDNGLEKAAILSTELLINHPEVVEKFHSRMLEHGWKKNQFFLMATHTHSSIGGWSPGFAGEFVSGKFDESVQSRIASAMEQSVLHAYKNLNSASIGYSSSSLEQNVRNRLVGDKGDEDVQARHLMFETDSTQVVLSTFAAHATCFGKSSRALTGDYPSTFFKLLEQNSSNIFPIFGAGAVASMGPDGEEKGPDLAKEIGEALAEQAAAKMRDSTVNDATASISSFQLSVPLRSPQLKISRNLKLRSWVFHQLVGRPDPRISVLKMNNKLMVGMPCDFSGELALPLYEYAQSEGLDLIITSFNGDYIGYVTKDERYDLPKYETRSMNWYGPDSGAYFSEIIRRIIDTVAE